MFVLHQAHRGVRGVGDIPPVWGFGDNASENLFFGVFCICYFAVFQHLVFANGFLIAIKELWLLTNISQWIRGFGCLKILYVVLYCKQCRYD